jgi:hypothetical protein
VAPVDLPAITGPIPALGDAHLDNPEGLGPEMPGDLLSQLPLFNLGGVDMAGQMTMPGPVPGAHGALSVLPEHGCQVICMASQLPPAAEQPDLPPWMMPMAPAPWMTSPIEVAPMETPLPDMSPAPAAPWLPIAAPDSAPAPEAAMAPESAPAPPPPTLGALPGPA